MLEPGGGSHNALLMSLMKGPEAKPSFLPAGSDFVS